MRRTYLEAWLLLRDRMGFFDPNLRVVSPKPQLNRRPWGFVEACDRVVTVSKSSWRRHIHAH